MNSTDGIFFLAQHNAKSFKPLRAEEVEDLNIPYFQIRKNENGYCGHSIDMFNYKNHDNEPRMPFYCQYLLQHVLPNVNKDINISGFYPIQLHDSYSYLNDGIKYDNVLTFSKNMEDRYPVLIPDPFMISNYGGRLSVKDPLLWDAKQSKIGFYGVTTGNTNPSKNKRINLCYWSKENRDISDFFITGVAQMALSTLERKFTDIRSIFKPPLEQTEQYRYRYILSIDGNTASWDRVPWVMKSNSLLFKHESNQILYYYPLIQEGTHFVHVDKNSFRKQFKFYEENNKMANNIVNNANKFIDTYIKPMNAILYLTHLFENFSDNQP